MIYFLKQFFFIFGKGKKMADHDINEIKGDDKDNNPEATLREVEIKQIIFFFFLFFFL